MILPVTKAVWEDPLRQAVREGIRQTGRVVPTTEDVIRDSVDFLLACCYIPDEEHGAIVTDAWLQQRGLQAAGKEAINWGDLHCIEVKRYADESWEVFIEEASPDCPALSAYIAKWLVAWGWAPVRVVTEW